MKYRIFSKSCDLFVITHYTKTGIEEYTVPKYVELYPVTLEGIVKNDVVFSSDVLEGIFVANKKDVVYVPA